MGVGKKTIHFFDEKRGYFETTGNLGSVIGFNDADSIHIIPIGCFPACMERLREGYYHHDEHQNCQKDAMRSHEKAPLQ